MYDYRRPLILVVRKSKYELHRQLLSNACFPEGARLHSRFRDQQGMALRAYLRGRAMFVNTKLSRNGTHHPLVEGWLWVRQQRQLRNTISCDNSISCNNSIFTECGVPREQQKQENAFDVSREGHS